MPTSDVFLGVQRGATSGVRLGVKRFAYFWSGVRGVKRCILLVLC